MHKFSVVDVLKCMRDLANYCLPLTNLSDLSSRCSLVQSGALRTIPMELKNKADWLLLQHYAEQQRYAGVIS